MKTSILTRLAMLAALAICCETSIAQAQYSAYHPHGGRVAVPRYGYHPGYGYHPVGAYGYSPYGYTAGSVGQGIGAAASGIGDLQKSHQQAAEQYIKNQGLEVETYAKNKKTRDQFGAQYRAAEKAHEEQQIAAHQKMLSQMAAPHRLTADQFDRTHGIIHWPYMFRDAAYSKVRFQLDKLYHERTPENSGEGSENYSEIQKACDQLEAIIKSQVKQGELTATDFVTAKHFAVSLCYESRFKVK